MKAKIQDRASAAQEMLSKSRVKSTTRKHDRSVSKGISTGRTSDNLYYKMPHQLQPSISTASIATVINIQKLRES